MLVAAVVAVRLLQYVGAAILFGTPLFFVYAADRTPPDALNLVRGAALLSAFAAPLAIAVQASLFAGSPVQGLTAEGMGAVVSHLALGKAAVVQACAAAAAFLLLSVVKPSRTGWIGAAALGVVAAGSLAWMGHAAATEGEIGTVHRSSDVMHALAASAWLGALVGFVLLARNRAAGRDALHLALRRFSALGPWLIALLVLTGLVNSWVLVGPENVGQLTATPYGRLLLAKLALFVAMLGLAATNRFRHTAAVAGGAPLEGLRRTVALETFAGLAVLALVAWLGTQAPPAA